MDSIDPARIDLAAEYKRNPFGPYSEDLQKVLRLMHWAPSTDRYISLQPQANGPSYLAHSRGGRGVDLAVYTDHPYTSAASVRWAVFQKRWQLATGELPVVDAGDEADPAAGTVTNSAVLVLPRITGYANAFSARAGEALSFHISGDVEGDYHADIVRLRCGDAANIGFRQTVIPSSVAGTYAARHQRVYPGSYVHVDDSLPTGDLAAHMLVWPTLPGASEQTLLSSWDAARQSGVWFGLDHEGRLTLKLGDGTRMQSVELPAPLRARAWYRVAFSVDDNNVWIAYSALAFYERVFNAGSAVDSSGVKPACAMPLRVAAWSDSTSTRPDGSAANGGHFNGKLEAPRVYCAAVPEDARDTFLATATWDGAHTATFAAWDFSRAQDSTRAVDLSPNGRDGTIVNMPNRAMKGAAWDGTEYNWRHCPEHYAAIHFHDDDLHDCGWSSDFSHTIP